MSHSDANVFETIKKILSSLKCNLLILHFQVSALHSESFKYALYSLLVLKQTL